MLTLDYFMNMIQNGFVSIAEDGTALGTRKFKKCIVMDNWTDVPVPKMAQKLNNTSTGAFMRFISS